MTLRKRWIVLPAVLVVLVAAWCLARWALAPDDSPRGLARQMASLRQPPGAIDELASALRLRPPRPTMDAIVRRLVATGPEAVGALTEMLADEDPYIRAMGARALYRMGPPAAEAVDELIEAMDDDDPQVRIWSVGALGEIGLPAAEPAIEPLIRALQEDESSGVRRSAAVALGDLGPGAAPAVGVLIETLRDPDVTVHRYAAEALGKIGAADDRVVGALTGAAADSYARDKAVEALRKLGAEVPPPPTAPATAPAVEHPTTRRHTHGM